MLAILFLCASLVAKTLALESGCDQKLLDRSIVTQCSPRVCEPVLETDKDGERPGEWPKTRDEVVQIVSSRDGERFNVTVHAAINTAKFYYEDSHTYGAMFIDPKVKYQRILGFGSSLTDSSGSNIEDLPADIRQTLIKDYFSVDEGIGLNLIKIPIGSTGYSHTNYVLDHPSEEIVELSAHDVDYRIPLIKEAMKAAGRYHNRVKLIAASKTAPPEYKENNKMVHGGVLRRDKIAEYGSYLTSFAAAYKQHGLSIWSLILSEAPMSVAMNKDANDTMDYNSMAMRPSDTLKLIEAIEQQFSKRSDLERFRMLILGDNRAHIPVWADAILGSQTASKSVTGVAYTNDERKFAPYDNLVYVTKRYPNKYLLTLDASNDSPLRLGDWQYAETYGTEIIKSLDYGSVGWIDSNLALDMNGGPVISDKFKSDAAIIVDHKRGGYYRNPKFYAIGHLSRYVKPGSIRVKATYYSSAHMYASQHIAFVTPDNYLVVVIMNNNIGPMALSIGIETVTKIETLLDTKSFNTFIFKL